MDISSFRAQFPALNQQIGDYPLVYLDTAATSQKPRQVLDAMAEFLKNDNANVHRAAHALSARATSRYEAVRTKVQSFINASRREEIIFTHGTTEAVNLVAHGLTSRFGPNDLILVDSAAHHANVVPWQELAKRTGANLVPIPLTSELRLDETAFDELLENTQQDGTQAKQRIKLVALSHVSNVLGTVNDVKRLCAKARAIGALSLVDGAQAVAHQQVDVSDIGCDFYAFSGHKMYGPDAVGVLYGRFEELDTLAPLLTGGEMIKSVSFDGSDFGELPNRLEAGTPPIVSVIGLGAAIDFLNSLDRAALERHERELMQYLIDALERIPAVKLYGIAATKADRVSHCNSGNLSNSVSLSNSGAVAFNLADEHHQDVGMLLDKYGIAVRSGHHCAMPLMTLMGVKGCCRASIGLYTSKDDIDRFIDALNDCADLLGLND